MKNEKEEGKVRVAVYARVSSEHEAQLSALDNQLDWYNNILVCKPEWKLVKTYVDKGITGTMANLRPQFMNMIADAKKKKFDLIITREVSRFARNTVDTLEYTRLLKRYGVDVFFLCDNIKTSDVDGELRLTIMAMLAQDESRKISVRVKSGVQTAREKGVLYGNGNILGYDRVGRNFVINPEQAETVRLVFEHFLSGKSLPGVAKQMEKLGRKTSTGLDHWNPVTVRQILTNTFYCGIITYNKYYVPDYLDHKAVVNRGEVEQTVIKGTHTPIISEEDFNKAQIIVRARRADHDLSLKKHPIGGKLAHKDFIGDILECRCGSNMTVRSAKSEKYSRGYYCSDMAKKTASGKDKGNPLCPTSQVAEFVFYSALNYAFSEWLTASEVLESVIDELIKKNKAFSGGDYDTEKETALREEIRNELVTACNELKSVRITDEHLRRFIEKIVVDGYSFDIYLCWNDIPVIPYKYRYEQDKYASITRKEIASFSLDKKASLFYYHGNPDERHHGHEIKFKIYI